MKYYQAKLKPFQHILDKDSGKKTHRTVESKYSVASWRIYHISHNRCLVIRDDHVKYFDQVVSTRLNTEIHRVQPKDRKIYDVFINGEKTFQVYDHWFEYINDGSVSLENELFEI